MEALIVTISGAKTRRKLEKDAEPTEKEAREAEILASAVPAGGALMAIGDTKEVAKLLLFRIALFGLAFLLFGGSLAVSFQNPCFILAGSSFFILVVHALFVIGSKIDIRAMMSGSEIFTIIIATLSFVMAFGPLVFFEVMLLAFAPLFFILDIVIAAVMLLSKKR